MIIFKLKASIYRTLIKAYMNKPFKKKKEFLACLKKVIRANGKNPTFVFPGLRLILKFAVEKNLGFNFTKKVFVVAIKKFKSRRS